MLIMHSSFPFGNTRRTSKLPDWVVCWSADPPRSKSWIAFNAIDDQHELEGTVPMTVESVRPWWCAADAVHVFRSCSVSGCFFLTACWIAVPTSALNWSVFFPFSFFPRVTGKSPEGKARRIFISTPPNIPFSIPRSSSPLLCLISLSLHLLLLGGWLVLSCVVFLCFVQ